MAERAGGGTSLRGLRERMVAAANAIAEERRSQGSFSSLLPQPSNIKSPFKPVIDGSVLKNDIKQRLAKERREEKKRQDDANKETQLLEKERKSKIVYEKQMEEKQRKLREQKEKDEQRRISAEKKRNEILEEEREKFKAVLHRTLERTSRIDHQKRWSWGGYTTVNSQNKTVNKHSTSTEKLEQGTCGLHRKMSSTGLQNSVAKKTPEKRRSSSLNRRCSGLHSSTETEQVEEKRPGIHSVIQYVNMPLLRPSSDELKSAIVPPQSTAVMPFQEKVEIPSKTSVGVAPKASVEVPPEVRVEALTKASLDESPQVNVEAPLEVSVEAFPEESMKKHPKVSVETLLEASMKEHPAVNVDALPEASMEEPPKKSESDEQPSNPITKKRVPPSQIPCYRWSSSPTRRWCPPSPTSARQIQKNCPSSPSPGTSKQSTQFCFSYKVIPTQRTVFAQNALGTMGMKSKAVSNTINNSEAASQEDMICEESGHKGTPGPKNAEEATKILAEKRRLAHEQKEEERLQKEMEQRKIKDVAKKVDEGQEDEFSKFGDGQQPKEMKKKESQEQEDQKVEFQKSDAKIKAQEEADKRKKEHERIMLQNLQERLERKKRIEEIMKRTRKPDSNASKATETLSGDAYEEDEADDEDEAESDSDSFDDMRPSATINGMDSSTKPKTHFKHVKNTSKFLDVTSSHIHKETKAFLNTDMKTFGPKGMKDPLNQTESTRSSTKRPTNRAAKTGKVEISSTVEPTKSSRSEAQKWVCDQIIDFSREAKPPGSSFPPESPKLQPRGSMTSCLKHQPPVDNKNRSQSVPAPSDM
ncbi:MAP7 domain-containing protein 3 isoform X2 [Capricornis sumatraensis]|uniref:MAP7 domain-containing protein 3 isoform X2 n=1 Tax=Capricornis sumatraensis TaxID=34865 RepID=UPI003605345C